MRFVVPVNVRGEFFGVWSFDGTTALRLGVTNPQDSGNAHMALRPNETLIDGMARQLPAFFQHGAPCVVADMKLKPGEYYPRIARPSDQKPRESPGSCPGTERFEHELASMRGQLVSLMHSLIAVCQTVQPTSDNFRAYGHEIRNLLILACTEVESHWKAVLAANGVVRDRYTTNDYVKLQEAMRLREYEVSLPYYPWLPPISPFKNWGTSGKPTQELEWFDAYNAVKHDREANFSRATLQKALEAVTACAIMLCAQFGELEAFRWRMEFGYFFQFGARPTWHPSELYIVPYAEHSTGPVPVNYQF